VQDCPLVLKEIRKVFTKKASLNDKLNEDRSNRNNRDQIRQINAKEKIAVRNLSLSFKKGEIFGLLGLFSKRFIEIAGI
jgi:ABC-type multidrug transport system ATPase subunit